MPAPADLAGRRFGRLAVGGRVETGRPGRWWRVTCDCGAVQVVASHHLLRRRRPKRSCGCLQREAAAGEMAAHNKRRVAGTEATCPTCGATFAPRGPNHKHCSRTCCLRAYYVRRRDGP